VDLLQRVVETDSYTELQCISWLRQICQGVAHMHKNNIIHLDIRVSTENFSTCRRPLSFVNQFHVMSTHTACKLYCTIGDVTYWGWPTAHFSVRMSKTYSLRFET